MTSFIDFLLFEFNRVKERMNLRRGAASKDPCLVDLKLDVDDGFLWLAFVHPEGEQKVAIPVPYKDENQNLVVGKQVRRAVGTWYIVDPEKGLGHGVEKTYWELMTFLTTDRIDVHFQGRPGVGKRSQLEKILVSFDYGKSALSVRNLQKLINSIVNELPVCETSMKTWAMNNRVVFVDPVFDSLPPQKVLEYQKEKNKLYFPWCSIGLSDSAMPKNYLLKQDLRNFTPFGIKHHNPMRNLYQTLGMKGDDQPLVQTKSMEKLPSKRSGYNWMTAFLDLPLNFEDQLMVDVRHQDKVSCSRRRFICFGTVVVREGDFISRGTTLSVEPGGKFLPFLTHADQAEVIGVVDRKIPFNGKEHDVKVVTVELKRHFKDGFKFTNLHGNKGIATFVDCGTMYDPVRKQTTPVDLIVSARTIKNRRNFGQALEALTTLLHGPQKKILLEDNYHADVAEIKKTLVQKGVAEDGTCLVDVPKYGQHKAICGWVFWGQVKEPEDSLWEKPDVLRTNHVGVRVSGVKISHIEMRGLITQFGPGSHVVKEILSYQEGVDTVEEYLNVLRSFRGELPVGCKVFDWGKINPLDQGLGFFHHKQTFKNTIADDRLPEEGFAIKLPFTYKCFVPKDFRQSPKEGISITDGGKEGKMHQTDTIYIPFAELRRPWQHQSGLWGLSDAASMINNILLACHSDAKDAKIEVAKMLRMYFFAAGKKLSTKSGLISTYSMSIRYPSSIKATASVTDKLPKNTIEIHKDMAKNLKVKHGDFVLTERFPCLGFMSLRVQQVHVTDDPSCKYICRVSGSSLSSQALDFDGDVLFLSSFNSLEANNELEYHFRFPNPTVNKFIEAASNKKTPQIAEATLDDLISWSLKNKQPPMSFAPVTPEISSEVAGALIGIKCGTGSSVALGYNLSRIAEGRIPYEDSETNAGVEVVLDKVANSVFQAKHKITNLLERLA